MHWIVADLLMFVSAVALYLAIRRASLANVSVQFNNLAMFGVPLVVFTVMSGTTRPSFYLSPWLAVFMLFTGVVLSYVSNALSLKSIELAPNPGYSLIISKSYVVLTTFLAVPLFGAHLAAHAVLAVIAIVASSGLIMLKHKKGEHARSSSWLPLALATFVGWAFLSLAAKFFFRQGVPTLVFLTYLFAIVTVCIAVEMKLRALSWRMVRENWSSFVLIGAASTGFNFFNFYAINIAPNVGYVNATNAASIGAVTVLAIIFFKDEFSVRKLIGVVGVIAGLLLLFLG